MNALRGPQFSRRRDRQRRIIRKRYRRHCRYNERRAYDVECKYRKSGRLDPTPRLQQQSSNERRNRSEYCNEPHRKKGLGLIVNCEGIEEGELIQSTDPASESIRMTGKF